MRHRLYELWQELDWHALFSNTNGREEMGCRVPKAETKQLLTHTHASHTHSPELCQDICCVFWLIPHICALKKRRQELLKSSWLDLIVPICQSQPITCLIHINQLLHWTECWEETRTRRVRWWMIRCATLNVTHLRFSMLHAFISPDKRPNFRNISAKAGASLLGTGWFIYT